MGPNRRAALPIPTVTPGGTNRAVTVRRQMATDIPPFGMSLLQINAVSRRFRDWHGVCDFGGAGRAVYQAGFAEFESWVSSVAVALSFKPRAASYTARAVLSDSQ
jgi:hypothetical protein